MGDIPFSQTHTEFLMAKAHGAALEKADAKKKAETAEEARKRVMAGVDPSRWSLVTRRDGAVRAAVKAAHDAKAHPAAPEEKPRTRWKFIPTPGQVVAVKIDGGTQYGKILDWGPGGVHVATRDGEIDAVWADVRPVPARELERLAVSYDEDIEQQAVRLSKFGFDDLRPGMLIQVGPTDWQHARGKVVYCAPQESAHQFLVIKTADGRYVAALPSEIQIIQRPDGSLPE